MSNRGRRKLPLQVRFSVVRPGPYGVTVAENQQLIIRYRSEVLGVVSDTPEGQELGYVLIESHKEHRRQLNYQRKQYGKPTTGKPVGRPLKEPATGCYKLGARMIQNTYSGYLVTHNAQQIGCYASYQEAHNALYEHVLFWRKHRKPTFHQKASGLPSKRRCYSKRTDGTNYWAVYHGRIVARGLSEAECLASIDEHWAFIQPIRLLGR